jgi:hypothetical protein
VPKFSARFVIRLSGREKGMSGRSHATTELEERNKKLYD